MAKNQIFTSFSDCPIWDVNKDYYETQGIDAWRSGSVPHHLTSNSFSGKTNAEIILGYLKDLANQGQITETVYIIELGAGHGRLAFHILKHLERLIELTAMRLPPYCFVITDFIEGNLNYFEQHPQFQNYMKEGLLDVSFFDATQSEELVLRYAQKTITKGSLSQSTVIIANYFFDSIPTDLFEIRAEQMYSCNVALKVIENKQKPEIKHFSLSYENAVLKPDHYKEEVYNDILEGYADLLQGSYIYFPIIGIECLSRLFALSKKGSMLLSFDKGKHEILDLEHIGKPDIVQHGSLSIWVNYHAFSEYCTRSGGTAFMPKYATNHFQCICLLFELDKKIFPEVRGAYERFINDFGPDDFNTIKRISYEKILSLSILELIALIRLSQYDSIIFKNYLPQLKKLAKQLSMTERKRLGQTMHKVWNMYFTLNEDFDLPYELAGLFYDLSMHEDSYLYYTYSNDLFGHKADNHYNMVMCLYQLRRDEELADHIKNAKKIFPGYERFSELDQLNLVAD